jgi:hypothetical protein
VTEEAVSADISTPFAVEDGAPLPVIASPPSENNLYHGTNAAAAEGAAVAAMLRAGVFNTIDAGVKTLEVKINSGGDQQVFDDFVAPLVKNKFLSSYEKRLGWASPNVDKLCQIGENVDLLRHERFISYFMATSCSGYTLVYQLTVLLGEMPADLGDDGRVQRLVDTLEREDIDTRQGMLDLTRQLKKAKRGPRLDLPTFAEAQPPDQISVDETGDPPSVHVEDGSDLVLAMPDRSDLRKLREGYVNPPRCLKVGEAIADNAVVIVVATLSDLPVIQYYFLPYFGFEGITPRLLLPQSPAGPEVTEAQVLIVAERPSGNRARLSEIVWPTEGETIDPLTLAAQLVPDARKKLVIFASEGTDGCQSIVGDANWDQADG